MQCPKCQQQNPEGVDSCLNCGADLREDTDSRDPVGGQEKLLGSSEKSLKPKRKFPYEWLFVFPLIIVVALLAYYKGVQDGREAKQSEMEIAEAFTDNPQGFDEAAQEETTYADSATASDSAETPASVEITPTPEPAQTAELTITPEITATATPAPTPTPIPVSIDDLQPGDILSADEVSTWDLSSYFKVYEIVEGDEVYQRIIGKSYPTDCPLSLTTLRYVKLIHYNFEGEIQVGELIVNALLADDYISAFTQLFQNQYQIQSMYLIDNYWTGDPDTTDSASIDENNTSCFNYRQVTGGGSLSNHATGCAIDINPQQNPYVYYGSDGSLTCSHANAMQYLVRETRDHMITHEDLCYEVFTELGFSWGGDWTSPIDYQHFSKSVG